MGFYLLADDTKKIFNILNLSKEEDIKEWDERWNELWKKGRDISFIKSPFFNASYDEIRIIRQRMGYTFDHSFCFAWKFRDSLPIYLKEKPVA